jgi:hypothetical protein
MLWRIAIANGWLLAAAATGGCYHQYLRVTRSDQLPEKEQKTVWSYAWGLVHSKDSVTVCGQTRALDQVEVKSNLGMTLLGILTLGIAVPRRMIWYCSTPRECPGDIGLASPTEAGARACVAAAPRRVTSSGPVEYVSDPPCSGERNEEPREAGQAPPTPASLDSSFRSPWLRRPLPWSLAVLRGPMPLHSTEPMSS